MDESIHILCVGDEPDAASLAVSALQQEDDRFHISTVADANAAFDILAEDAVDCIISNQRLSAQTGIEFLHSVRSEYPDLPFILFTNKDDEQTARDAIDAGVTDYFREGTGSQQYVLLANRINSAVQEYRTQREFERQNALFAKAQEMAHIGAWEYNLATETSFVTDEVLRIHGLEPDENLPAEKSIGYYHPEDRDTIEDAFTRAIEEGKAYDLELRLITDTGDHRWVRTLGEPTVNDGEVVCLRGVIQDITEQKEREARLEQRNEQLEQFADVVSHDIRNPLQVAKGYLDEAKRTSDDDAFNQVQEAHERIETILHDVLELAKQGHQISSTETVDIGTAAQEAWKMVDTDKIQLRTTSGAQIEADPPRLHQLFENLFRNSVEHAGTDVTVTVGPIDPMPTTTRSSEELPNGFYVSDDGAGIPEEQREAVFESGYTTSDDGTGFGLAIVDQIASAHGWEATVTESRDGGARFEFVNKHTPH